MAGFVPFFLQGLGQASSTRYRSTATNIARQRMEEVRQLDYREINDGSTLAARFGTTETVRGATFTTTYVVEEVAYDVGVLKKVIITVTWTAPPTPSPAVISSLIHQQYVGPRGERLVLEPTVADPLGTPFRVLSGAGGSPSERAFYYIAEADWNLVYPNPDSQFSIPFAVYLRLVFVDDAGVMLPLGEAGNDYMISDLSQYLKRSWNVDGTCREVYFEYPFDPGILPDGYWELRAVAFNPYDEPGNVWRLRLGYRR